MDVGEMRTLRWMTEETGKQNTRNGCKSKLVKQKNAEIGYDGNRPVERRVNR